MKIKPEYVIKQVQEDYIVLPTGHEAVNFNGVITLNKSGARLFMLLQENSSKEELIEFLLNSYDVTVEQASKDVTQFLDVLLQHNILE